MSVDATSWAWQQCVGKSTTKFVLVALADRAGADNTAWPSVAKISKDTEQDRKTVINGLKALVAGGFIEDTGIRKGSTGKVIVYRLIGVNNRHEDEGEKQYQKRNDAKNGTVNKNSGNGANNGPVELYQKRNDTENGTVPYFPDNSTENGTLNSTENGTQNLPVEPTNEPVGDGVVIESVPEQDSANANSENQHPVFLSDLNLSTAADLKNQRRFQMHFQWMPSAAFKDRCRMAGVLFTELTQDEQDSCLGEFRSYWEGRADQNSQSGWEHKLMNQVKRLLISKANNPVGELNPAKTRANVSASVMDVNNTDW